MVLLSLRTLISDLAFEIRLSGSKTISKSCHISVLCFVWNSFLHYLHTSNPTHSLNTSVAFPWSLPSFPQLGLIFYTSKVHNNSISVISYISYKFLTCRINTWDHNIFSLLNYKRLNIEFISGLCLNSWKIYLNIVYNVQIWVNEKFNVMKHCI